MGSVSPISTRGSAHVAHDRRPGICLHTQAGWTQEAEATIKKTWSEKAKSRRRIEGQEAMPAGGLRAETIAAKIVQQYRQGRENRQGT